MHYLTCGHCGFENEVTSEYLVFCGNCNKKIPNSFSAWSSENPGKSFDDFKNEVCHTKPQTRIKEDEKIRKTRRPKQFTQKLVFGFIVVFLLSAAGFFVIKGVFFQTLEKYTTSDWTAQTCGTLGLRLTSPVELKANDQLEKDIPPEIKRVLVSIESYAHESSSKKLFIIANSFQYLPEIKTSLNGAVEGSIRERRGQQGVTGFTWEITDIYNYGIPGALITGRYKEGNRVIGFQQAIYTQGSFMWQIMVGFDYQDPSGQEIATRIISSITINKDFASI